MAAITGATGSVTSWAGAANTLLIATSSAPSSFTINYSADEMDTTGFAATNSMTAIAGLKTWSGSISTRYQAAQIGAAGSVTYASGDVLNTNAWQMSMASAAKETTAFGASVKSFIPSLLNWSGSYSGYYDGTTALTGLGVDPPAAASFALDGTRSLIGAITITSQSVSSSPAEVVTVQQGFKGSGALAGLGASGFFAASEVLIPVVGSLVLSSSTGQTFTGNAFWTSLTVVCPVAGLVTMEIGFQGTGALTIA